MADFSFLNQYILVNENDPSGTGLTHNFYPVKVQNILEAEERLDFLLPKELDDFYKAIGYGFMYNGNDKMAFNRFIGPSGVADIYLRAEYYEEDPDLDIYDDPDRLIFFEIMEGLYLTLDLTVKGDKSPVYYMSTKITDSIEEFLRRFNADSNYLDQFDEEDE